MIKFTQKQFNEILKWKLKSNPFKAIEDFSELKTELRWENKENFREFKKNSNTRKNMLSNKKIFKHYKKTDKTIDRISWNYLRERKPYYIMPLGWDIMAKNGGNIIDVGCGDGDTIQNLIDYILRTWKRKKIKPKKINIVGCDISNSRLENAKRFVKSDSKYIKVKFINVDLTKKNVRLYKNNSFDFCICTGFLDMLNQTSFNNFMTNINKIVKKGIYVQDLLEHFPGGFPRENLGMELFKKGFKTKKKYKIFNQPFSKKKLLKPIIAAILLVQNLYAEKH
jgi:ubiquinone/menaquinone biosynthesis C-methylase UbiE|tara:strand:+ start:780 stop:1622 length:843 start_codon:yes stop_codon:yes gene_type:complete